MSVGVPPDGATAAGMTFTRRPASVPPDLRPEWRIPLLLLLVHHCRGQLVSREQLHVLNSAVLSEGSRRALLAALDGRLLPQIPMVQFEPALERAVDRCIGLGLLRLTNNGRLQLTDVGESVVAAIQADDELFTLERRLLGALPRSLSQSAIRTALATRTRP